MTSLTRFIGTCFVVTICGVVAMYQVALGADGSLANRNTDAMPAGTGPTHQILSVPGDTLYTFTVPSQIILGVQKLGNKLIFTSGGQSSAVLTDNKWVITDLNGNFLDTTHLQINNTAGQGFGFRDLAWDGRWLLTSDGPTVRRIDTASYTETVPAQTGPGTLQRGLAADGLNRRWKSNFTTDPIVVFDTLNASIRNYGIPAVAPYGIALDKWTTPGKMWLWMTEPSIAGTSRLSKVDTATGTIVQSYNYSAMVPAAATVGGLDIANNHPAYPGRVVAFIVEQAFPSSKVLVVDLGPDSSVSSGADTLLVIYPDSATGTATNIAQKKADRDTTNKYIAQYVPGAVRRVYIDTTGATLPSLTNYKRILYVESSFDAAISRHMGVSSRTAVKAWLNAGTAGDKRKFVMIGADIGYNYSRTGSTGLDTTFSHSMLKYVYVVDNGNTAGSVTGIALNPGSVYPYSTAVTGFWPDGCNYRAGGTVLYKYTSRATADSAAGVGYVATGYTSACIFQDPRYYTGTFGPVLRSALQFAGVVTDVKLPTSNELPSNFVLSQNYPNPFNPTTTIQFGLPVAANVTLKVYNVLGQEVATLVEGPRSAGTFQAVWNGRNSFGDQVASGMYFYSLVAKATGNNATITNIKKMLLLK